MSKNDTEPMQFHSADWLEEFQRKADTLATAIDNLGQFLENNPPDNEKATESMHNALKHTGRTLIKFSKTMTKEWLLIDKIEGARK